MSFASPAEATFSLAAVDAGSGESGALVASCVGETFSLAEVVRLDPARGLVLAQGFFFAEGRDALVAELGRGLSPEEALAQVTAPDFDPEQESSGVSLRQYAVLDADGKAATFTGARSLPFAGDRQRTHDGITFTVQGNVLSGPEVLDALEEGFTLPAASLGERLLHALEQVRDSGAGDARCAPHMADAAHFEWHRPGRAPLAATVFAPQGSDVVLHLNEAVGAELSSDAPESAPPASAKDAAPSGCAYGVAGSPSAGLPLWAAVGALLVYWRAARGPRSSAPAR